MSALPPDYWPKRVAELQEELAGTILQYNTSQQDSARLFEMLELLKQKYNTLLDLKGRQAEDLLRAEEEKLALAKSLVELKIEFRWERGRGRSCGVFVSVFNPQFLYLSASSRQESSERERFDLSTHLLESKNEVCELETQVRSRRIV